MSVRQLGLRHANPTPGQRLPPHPPRRVFNFPPSAPILAASISGRAARFVSPGPGRRPGIDPPARRGRPDHATLGDVGQSAESGNFGRCEAELVCGEMRTRIHGDRLCGKAA